MSFLHPLILTAGLAALAIPVLVHLLRRRRKPIPWAAMRFLQEAVRQRRRRLRLEQLLLFLTRCALVLLLALAVARPILGARPGSARPTTLVLAIDDSIGSALMDGAGTSALSRSVDRARRELDALSAMGGDRVGVVTLGAPGRALVWPPSGDLDAARRALDRLQPTDSAVSLDALRTVLGERRAEDDQPDRLVLRVLSEWRGVDAERLLGGAPLPRVDEALIDPPATGDAANTGIAAVVATTPTVLGTQGVTVLAPPTQVGVSVVRSGGGDAGATVDVEIIARPGGSIAGRGQARFSPGQDRAQATIAIDEAALSPGRGGRVTLEARLSADANPRDNAARAVLTVRRELRVGVVERPPLAGAAGVAPGVWTMAALTPDARVGIDAFRIDPVSLASVPAASVDALVILEPSRVGREGWARVRELLARGGLVVIAPDADATSAPWRDALAELTGNAITVGAGGVGEVFTRLGARVEPDGLLAGLAGEFVELARSVGVRRTVGLEVSGDAAVTLTTEDGSAFLAESRATDGRGMVVVFASALALDWTDLPARPAFLPVMQELVRRGSGLGLDASASAGRAPPDEAGIDRWVFDTDLTGAPAPTGETGARAGVLLGLASEGSVVRSVAVNPDAEAARVEAASLESLRSAAATALPGAAVRFDRTDAETEAASVLARATPAGDRLALLLLALAAVLAVIETVLARAASHPEGGGA